VAAGAQVFHVDDAVGVEVGVRVILWVADHGAESEAYEGEVDHVDRSVAVVITDFPEHAGEERLHVGLGHEVGAVGVEITLQDGRVVALESPGTRAEQVRRRRGRTRRIAGRHVVGFRGVVVENRRVTRPGAVPNLRRKHSGKTGEAVEQG